MCKHYVFAEQLEFPVCSKFYCIVKWFWVLYGILQAQPWTLPQDEDFFISVNHDAITCSELMNEVLNPLTDFSHGHSWRH